MDIVTYACNPIAPTWTFNFFKGFDISAGVDYRDFKEKRFEALIYWQIFTTRLCFTMDVNEDIVQ